MTGYDSKKRMAADKMQKQKILDPLTMSDDELIAHSSKQVQALRMALDMIECEKYERRHVRWAIIDALKEEASAQRTWVGLNEQDFSAINQSCLTKLQAATSAESILKEKNNG